ncbi:MAG: CRISPR system precrRNA processing endoribonuclease RAMP protein Cas6 [Dehalococcoidia bacterium]
MNLEAHLLRFQCQALTEIATPPFKGSMIRGALFGSLRQDFCLDQQGRICSDCKVRQACPVCSLLATADEDSPRGIEVARPCTVEPPLEVRTLYGPGDRFSFGVTLFGDAAHLLPYVIIGVRKMGELGVGNRYRASGRFAVQRIEAVDPISDRTQEIHRQGESLVQRPGRPVTHEVVMSSCRALDSLSGATLELLTPTRLVAGGALVKRLTFPVFLRRLLRRLTDLTRTATGSHPGFDHEVLLQQAEDVRVAEDRTRWVDVPSYSSRQGRFTPIGGLVGEVTFEGDLRPFAPWLLWGSITHVGKDATKGGGWYRLRWQN